MCGSGEGQAQRLPPACARNRAAAVGDDGQEPGPEAFFASQAGEVSPGPECRLLDRVARLLPIPEHDDCQPVGGFQHWSDERVESGLITGHRLAAETGLGMYWGCAHHLTV